MQWNIPFVRSKLSHRHSVRPVNSYTIERFARRMQLCKPQPPTKREKNWFLFCVYHAIPDMLNISCSWLRLKRRTDGDYNSWLRIIAFDLAAIYTRFRTNLCVLKSCAPVYGIYRLLVVLLFFSFMDLRHTAARDVSGATKLFRRLKINITNYRVNRCLQWPRSMVWRSRCGL